MRFLFLIAAASCLALSVLLPELPEEAAGAPKAVDMPANLSNCGALASPISGGALESQSCGAFPLLFLRVAFARHAFFIDISPIKSRQLIELRILPTSERYFAQG